MALFKILKGQQARLPNTSKQGYAYYTTDKGKFYIFNSETQRRTLNPDIKITIGNQTKTSTTLSPEVAFDLASIGAAAAGHNHDNRYLKLSGGTMTGDIIFTNKDANRLIWTDEDKKVSTTGHYATSDRVAINSASYPGYNLLVNGTTLFQGETVTRIVRPEETKKYSLGTDDYKWSALYVSGNAQIDGSIKNLAVNGGIYWNPHVESTGDASDAASIEVITAGVAGGTQLRIQQQNDANDVVNIVTNATTGFKHNGHTVWDDTNDGPGSGADADLLDGCHGSYQPSANTYVRREGNGYTKQNYILYTPNKDQNPSIGSFVVTNTGDNYLRFATKINVVNQLAESPGTLINNNGHTYSITVTGDANTYYPVVIDTPLEKEAINYVSIWKNLGSQTATYTGNHDNGTSSMWLIYEVRKWVQDGNGGYLKCWYYSMPYANLCATTSAVGSGSGKLVVYLRGGGTSYNISTTYKSSVSVYYQQTNLGDSSSPVRVSPTTSISNRGKYSTTFLGYGDVAGNADTSTIPLGFASRNTNVTWGNQTGTTITCWDQSSGGSVEFRRNNPSNGKLSIKVNGRFYGNEGSYPAMLIRWRNNYWGLGNPDGDDSDWIRTTVNGLIPFQSGGQGNGNSALGTSSWYFKEAFIDTVNGTNLYLRGQTANRLVWLNSSKMLDTTGHYASGSKIAVNSIEEPGYNFYVNGSSYLNGTETITGVLTSPYHNFIVENEFNFLPSAGTVDVWFNYVSGENRNNTTTKLTAYYFGNGQKDTATDLHAGWFISKGATGWRNETYDGGWYMIDSTWIRTYGDKNVYQNTGVIRTDGTFQVGDSGNKFYASNSGNGYFSNTLGIAGVNTNYKLYVVGQSWISGTLWNQHLYPEATKTYDLGSTSYIWNNIYGNQLWLYNLQEGNSDITDNTEILTSYASDNGFADSNAVGKVYKRDAIHLYNYIISKTDNFYVKKAGDTMTGNLSFSSIGDVATSAKISWNGSTDGADIYYQTTEADQGNLVLNTRDDANCYIRFAYNGAFKSYIRTSDGTYIGKLLGISEGSSWINGQRYERGGFNLSNATTTTDYWPWLRQTNTSSARWFSFGTLGNCFYMIGSSTGRTDNGYDHGLCYDISNGNLSGINDIHTSSIYASNWFRSQGNSGWYSQNYDGGWYMIDSTWIRSFNNKSLYTGTGTIRSEREIQSTSIGGVCQFRAIGGAYGAMLRNDGADTWILLTNAWDQYGSWNGLRPFRINNGSGGVYIQTSLIYQHFTPVGNLYVGWNEGSSPALTASYGGTTASGSGNVITEARMKAAIANKHGSDRRVKQNIRDLSIQTIKKIYMNFKPVRYEFKQGALADKYAPGERFGYIAQDMESSFLKYGVNPGQLVYHQHNIDKTSKLYSYLRECNLYTIDYENLHALHTLMIQQHDSQIEQLKKQNKKLQQQIQLLNAKLDTLVVSHL